jgi:glycosyltransferase involved in cell wall biosynthesis
MKILVTMFDINDYGGIIQHTELLLRGLRELGHECTFRILRCADRPSYTTSLPIKGAAAFPSQATEVKNGEITLPVFASQSYGWRGARVQCYGSKQRLAEYRELANAHDLILHEIPIAKPDSGGYWQAMFERVRPPQISISHDAHYRELYPHLIFVAKQLTGVACVHHSSYVALEQMPVPRALIPSGHRPLDWDDEIPWKKRVKRFVCAHIWKRWKHMDLVVRAIPHLPKGIRNLMGGDGIERRYMASRDKCREAYMDGKKHIWEQAIFAGMNWRGDTKQEELLQEYGKSRVMVDMSYSKKFAELGNHVNRSTFDAYNTGCVPLLTTENMAVQGKGLRKMFERGATHLEVPANCSPQELAQAIGLACDTPDAAAKRIIECGRHLLMEKFHYQKSAQAYLNLARGKSAGLYGKPEKGTGPITLKSFAVDFIEEYQDKMKRRENEE